MPATPPLPALAAILALAAAPLAADTAPGDLIGTWVSPLAEQPSPDGSASAWIRSEVIFTDTEETLVVRAFGDPDATAPLFTYRSSGPWALSDDPSAVDGALAIDLRNTTSTVTMHADIPLIVAAIAMQDCDLQVGVAAEIADCVAGPPFIAGDCLDMDVVMVDAVDGRQRLRFGEQSVDRCATRPDALDAQAFLAVPG